jgi:N-dimethylarginine dimethylaminohydrolase
MIELHDGHPLLRFWSEGATYHLDVRALLEQGGEPYLHIMDCVNQVQPGETLVVHALFEPRPLIAQVARMGLHARSERLDAEHWTLIIAAED